LVENRNKEIGKLLRLLGEKKIKTGMRYCLRPCGPLELQRIPVTKHSSFELVYGREDQQPFDIAARPTKGVNKPSYEILSEKFISHYRGTIEAAENVKNASKYWANREEEKSSMKNSKKKKKKKKKYKKRKKKKEN